MVTFYIGSVSHCIEKLLMNAGILTQGRQNVKQSTPLYKTNIPCEDAGPFSSPVVVALHPVPRDLLEKAVDSTSCLLGAVSALPIHIGDPSVIGINDINQPDFGDPPVLDDSVPVFWASCATAHLAVRSAGIVALFCSLFFFLGLFSLPHFMSLANLHHSTKFSDHKLSKKKGIYIPFLFLTGQKETFLIKKI